MSQVSTTATFNGGWQLLSFAGNAKINALNWRNEYLNCGGQDYGEVIFFSEMPTDAERLACERYLAKKWGVAQAVHKGEGPEIRLQGNGGDVRLSSGVSATVNGLFSGRLTLDGGLLTVADNRLPIGEDAIPSDGRVAWFDPNAEGALAMSTYAERADCVRVVHGRDNNGVVTTSGGYYLLGTDDRDKYDRRPWLNEGSRGGLATKWLDFANKYDNKGNTLRLFQEPAPTGESSDTSAKSVDVRTAFVALDSSNGGGMPLIDTVGANGKIKNRQPTRDSSMPIWTNATDKVVTEGTTRLDGVVVAGTTQGYNSCPEVLSLETTAALPLSYFGWYGSDSSTTPNAEVLGEILLFNKLLPSETRVDVEAYLMKKWTGRLPTGYADLRAATISGSGTVRAKNMAALPTFDDSFTGTLELEQSAFAFTLDTRKTPAVAEAMTLPCTVDLPAACTVSVTCAAKPKPGVYPLVTAAAFTGVETCTLNVLGDTGGANLRLVVDGTTLSVLVPARGTAIFIR